MKVVPTIYNGAKKMVLSETFVFEKQLGIVFEIPLVSSAEGNTTLKLYFEIADEAFARKFLVDGIYHLPFENYKDGMRIFLLERPNRMFAGTVNASGFSVRGATFEIWHSLVNVSDGAHQMTVTLYEVTK